jgi:hypothetical protein
VKLPRASPAEPGARDKKTHARLSQTRVRDKKTRTPLSETRAPVKDTRARPFDAGRMRTSDAKGVSGDVPAAAFVQGR